LRFVWHAVFPPSLAADALETRAFQGMPADFIKGADISTLLDAEKHGAKFYDQNNQRRIRSPF
jgi:arabinogalactan endo-1,4-beta-galactosidase